MRYFTHSKHSTRSVLFAALVLPFAFGCADPAADAPKAVVEEAAATEEMDMAGDGVPYTLTEASKIAFVGSKVTGSHDGGFENFSGTILLVDGKAESSSLEVEIDTNSLWADSERLTGHLKSPDFFEVETYPTARFNSTSITADDAGLHRVTGNLELHGVTKQISFPASIEVGADEIRATAEFAIKRFDFDIVYPGKAEDLIRDDVLVKLDLVAVPAG